MNVNNALFEAICMRLIFESRVDDALRKYPMLSKEIEILAARDPSGRQAKYVTWMARQVAQGEDVDEVVCAVDRFNAVAKRLSNSDINAYRTLDQLSTALSSLKPSSSSRRLAASAGAKKIASDGVYDVFRIDTHAAAMKYGKGTRWCITEADGNYWSDYRRENTIFYFAIKHSTGGKQVGSQYDKVAFQVQRDIENNVDEVVIYDARDREVSTFLSGPDVIGYELFDALQIDAGGVPTTREFILFELDDEQLLEIWSELGTRIRLIVLMSLFMRIRYDGVGLELPLALSRLDNPADVASVLEHMIDGTLRIDSEDSQSAFMWTNVEGEEEEVYIW